MPDYRRYYVAGGTYFFTVVTAGRARLFSRSTARSLLGKIMREEKQKLPFETVAIVLLPDHLHVIWALPRGDDERQAGQRTPAPGDVRIGGRDRIRDRGDGRRGSLGGARSRLARVGPHRAQL